MTTSTKRLLLVLAALSALVPAARAADCKPVYGFYSSELGFCGGLPCTQGQLIGGIQADYAFAATGVIPPNALVAPDRADPALEGAIFYVGKSDVALKSSGDHVFASDSGVIDVGGTGKQAALLVITGGSGAHAGATGYLQLRGTVQGSHVTGDYRGEVCTP